MIFVGDVRERNSRPETIVFVTVESDLVETPYSLLVTWRAAKPFRARYENDVRIASVLFDLGPENGQLWSSGHPGRSGYLITATPLGFLICSQSCVT